MKKLFAIASAVIAIGAAPDAHAQVLIERGGARGDAPETAEPQPKRRSSSRGSVYQRYGSTAFIRGGLFFADTEAGTDVSQPYGAIGYRRQISRRGRSNIGLEGEIVGAFDSETIDVLGTIVDTDVLLLAGVGSARLDYEVSRSFAPFASVGLGVAYARASVDDGVTEISDGEVAFAYTGRAGFAANFSDRFGIEAAYRYLGVTSDATGGLHGGELGLNYRF